MPDAADYEDIGSEVFTMIQRHQSMQTVDAWCDEIQTEWQTEQTEQLPKQVIWTLYGVLGLAVGMLAWLCIKML